MDIIAILKIVISLALAMVPIGALILIASAYSSDLGYIMGTMTDNGFLVIVALSMDKALENVYFSAIFGTMMTALSTVAVFRLHN